MADFDLKLARRFHKDILGLEAEIDTARSEFSVFAKGRRKKIRDVKLRAQEAGINRVAFDAYIADQKLAAKRIANREALDIDERSAFQALLDGLGDFAATELGTAAVEAARDEAESEAFSAMADNAKRLAAGIKTLNA